MRFKEADKLALDYTFPSDRWWRIYFPFCLYYWFKVLIIWIVVNTLERGKSIQEIEKGLDFPLDEDEH